MFLNFASSWLGILFLPRLVCGKCAVVSISDSTSLGTFELRTSVILESSLSKIPFKASECELTVIEFEESSRLVSYASLPRAFHRGKFQLLLRFSVDNVPEDLQTMSNVKFHEVMGEDELKEKIEALLASRYDWEQEGRTKPISDFRGQNVNVGYFSLAPFIYPSAENKLNSQKLKEVKFDPKDWQGYEAKLFNFSITLMKPEKGLWGGFNVSGKKEFEPGLNRDLWEGRTDLTLVNPIVVWRRHEHFDLTTYFGGEPADF